MKVSAQIYYDRRREIGMGDGMNSRVYLAYDAQLSTEIVAKEIPKTSLNAQEYFDEAATMHKSHHRNVAPLHYACDTGTDICIAMPFFPKGSLQSRLHQSSLTISETLRVVDGVLSGLGHIHTQGFVHCDIKPTNIFFGDNDTPLLADFGQARKLLQQRAAPAPPMYTNALPPEVLKLGVVSPAGDIYQVGLTMYRCLQGEGYYQDELTGALSRNTNITASIVNGSFPRRNALLPHLPRRVVKVLRKSLSMDPQRRYQSATEMAQDLGGCSYRCDWKVTTTPTSRKWRAARAGKADLLVEMTRTGPRWSVEAYSIGASKRRKESSLWLQNGTKKQAEQSARAILRALDE